MKPFTNLLACMAVLLAAPVSAKTLTIGIDRSGSSPLVISPEFARAVAPYVSRDIAALEIGDTVVIRSFGVRGIKNITSRTLRITKASRPREVANAVARFIAELPAKNIGGQDATNIIAFLEFGRFDCTNGGRIVLLTDGMESSSYTSARDLASGKPLPEPQAGLLAGCEVSMIGFGHTSAGAPTPLEVKAALSGWRSWMKIAGAPFTAIIDL